MSRVLDASALVAFLHGEPGGEAVSQALEGAWVSAVNWAEVLQKSLQRTVEIAGMEQDFVDVGVSFEPFTSRHAEIAANLWARTREFGLSLSDRACLALAMEKALPVLTADRAWSALRLDVEVRVVR